MAGYKVTRRISRLINLKIKEIIEGCLYCQGKKSEEPGVVGCTRHTHLINQMVLHPKQFARTIQMVGEQVDPAEYTYPSQYNR